MGFGRHLDPASGRELPGPGILATPRRRWAPIGDQSVRFGTVVDQLPGVSNITVVTPEGTPEFVRPERPNELPIFPHEDEAHLFDLVPHYDQVEPNRTLITDARDLLLNTLYERTASRDNRGNIIPGSSPLLPCIVEGPGTWSSVSASPSEPLRGFIHIGRTRRAEQLLGESLVRTVVRGFGWDGELSSLDSDGYVILILARWVSTQPLTTLFETAAGTFGAFFPGGIRVDAPPPERHIVLVGGTDRATYYAVSDFLRTYARAQWLFPGSLGTVIPQKPTFEIEDTSRIRLEEPDYRGRALVAISDSAEATNFRSSSVGGDIPNQSARQIHDVRNWLLRNRLHPSKERGILHKRRNVPDDHPQNLRFDRCASLDPAVRRYLGVEDRIPVGHTLSGFFSPDVPSWDASTSPFMLTRAEVLPGMYPAPFPRRLRAAATIPVGNFPALAGQDRYPCAVITPQYSAVESPDLRICPLPFFGFEGWPEFVTLRAAPDCLPAQAPSANFVQTVEQKFARVVSTTEQNRFTTRFIPRTRRFTHERDSAPTDGWVPCFFQPPPPSQMGSENRHAEFRETVAVDLANQLVYLDMMNRVLWPSRNPEFCESLAADDGSLFWCECIPCRSTNSRDAMEDSALLFKGRVYLREFREFESGPDPARNPNRVLSARWLSQNPASLPMQMIDAGRVLRRAAFEIRATLTDNFLRETGLDSVPVFNNLGLQESLDRLSLRGMIPDRARLHVRSRRLFVLLNETALTLVRIARAQGGYQGPYPAAFALNPDHTLFTFLAYLDYTAPPIFEHDPDDPVRRTLFYPSPQGSGTIHAGDFYANNGSRAVDLAKNVLHPVLTPMISGSRDLLEYDDEPRGRAWRHSDVLTQSPFFQHRIAPEQFNLRRWSMVAHQTGLYEWMYGRVSLVPRIYTKRLRNALKNGFENYRTRVFLAEVEPHMGLDGIKPYEVAQVLWDVNTPLVRIRREFCDALSESNTALSTLMQLYFNELEEIWCSREQGSPPLPNTTPPTPPPPQHRYASGFNLGTYLGYGALGRLGWITELEPFMRTPEQRSANIVPDLGQMPFDRAWGFIDQAYHMASDAGLNTVKERIQYFRRAIALLGELIRVFHPIWAIWTKLEPLQSYPTGFPSPRDWADNWVLQHPSLLTTDTEGARIRNEVRVGLGLGPRTGVPWLAATAVPWITAAGFRTAVRGPIHEYIVESFERHRGRPELGLGLGARPAIPRSRGTFPEDGLLNLAPERSPLAQQAAFCMRYVLQYAAWWDGAGGNRFPDRSPGNQEDNGIGIPMFGSMKQLIVAIMTVGAQQRPRVGASPLPDPDLGSGSIGIFLRDA